MLHLLMLAFFLADVDGRCSLYNTTLRLVPTEVVEEYGREVSVNCTSEDEFHDGMYWKYGNRESNLTEDDSFTSWTLSLSEWNVTAAECVLKFPDGLECSEDLEITLYKNPGMVNLYPTRYVSNMVEGTLYELQCDIVDVAPLQNLTVRWYKDNQVVRTESFTSNTTRTPVSESSLFTVNISSEDDGARFTCEAQLDFGPHGLKPSVLSEPHVISVHYAPELNGTAEEDVYVVKGADLTLVCDAKGNPPPDFRWTRDGVNMTEDKSHVYVSQVNASVSYVCNATNRVGTTTKRIHVHVREDVVEIPADALTPSEPPLVCPLTVPDKVAVRFGDPLLIDCVTYKMSWTDSNGSRFYKSTTATWKMEKVKEWSIKPECYVSLTSGQTCSATPAITVYKTPDTVSLSASTDGPMVENTEHLLTCHIDNVAPVQNLAVTWYRGNKPMITRGFSHNQVTPANMSSQFTLIPKRDDDGAQYSCSAELHLGQQTVPAMSSEPYTAVVHFAPEIKERNVSMEFTPGENVTLDCHAEGNPVPEVLWKNTSAVNVMQTTGGRHGSIRVTVATSTNAGVYICVATNEVGTVSRSVTLLMKGQAFERRLSFILWPLLIFIILFFVVVFVLCRCRKKHGQYSFITDKDIPLMTKSDGRKL